MKCKYAWKLFSFIHDRLITHLWFIYFGYIHYIKPHFYFVFLTPLLSGTFSFLYLSSSSFTNSHETSSDPSSQSFFLSQRLSNDIHSPAQQVNCVWGWHWTQEFFEVEPKALAVANCLLYFYYLKILSLLLKNLKALLLRMTVTCLNQFIFLLLHQPYNYKI